ncbi:hypothetical protein [Vibrio sp. WXL210]|uniref:hypothetical protein n=1 Tax=Vibrio sp. WXL210 TaxID=3450709 RepID=UPI003EC72445
MDKFENRLEQAEKTLGLKKVVQINIINRCNQEGVELLVSLPRYQFEQYVEQVVLAAWLDLDNEVGAEDLSWNEKKSDLTERAMRDVTRLLRLIALRSFSFK